MESQKNRKLKRGRPKPPNNLEKRTKPELREKATNKKKRRKPVPKEVIQAKKRKRTKENTKKRKNLKKRKKKQKKITVFFMELFGALAVTGVILFILSFFFFTFVKVEGYSMIPTLRDGEFVYVSKRAKIKTFDLVAIQRGRTKQTDIRRVIGLPGQTVVYKNDQLTIDGVSKEETFIQKEQQQAQENGRLFTEDFSILSLTGETKIPEGKYLVLGDNRPYASDSRYYQLLDEKEIVGKVEMRVLPLHKFQRVK
jgi:signal peptidase I